MHKADRQELAKAEHHLVEAMIHLRQIDLRRYRQDVDLKNVVQTSRSHLESVWAAVAGSRDRV